MKDRKRFVVTSVCVALAVNIGIGLARHHSTPEEIIMDAGGNVYDEERHAQTSAISDQLNQVLTVKQQITDMQIAAMKPLNAAAKAEMTQTLAVLTEKSNSIKISDTLEDDITAVMRRDEADEFENEYANSYSDDEKRLFINKKHAEIKNALLKSAETAKEQEEALEKATELLQNAETTAQVTQIQSYIDSNCCSE